MKYELPDKPLIIIGNPPFGHRGVVALEFINYSRKAEFVCFILPMFFDSKGKGSILNEKFKKDFAFPKPTRRISNFPRSFFYLLSLRYQGKGKFCNFLGLILHK